MQALNLGFESNAVFKQANYMNYELHDCYAHKFINYEIFGASFAILLCLQKKSLSQLLAAKQ
jgi:hypothetical protein